MDIDRVDGSQVDGCQPQVNFFWGTILCEVIDDVW